jgi:hypothetical protein
MPTKEYALLTAEMVSEKAIYQANRACVPMTKVSALQVFDEMINKNKRCRKQDKILAFICLSDYLYDT